MESTEPEVETNPERLTYLVKHLELAIRAGIDRVLRDTELATPQYTALGVLARHPGMSAADLGRRLFVSPQAAHMTVLALEQRGLVSREILPDNRRSLSVRLTPGGLGLLRRCDKLVDELDAAMLANLDQATQELLRAAMWSCVEALKDAAAR